MDAALEITRRLGDHGRVTRDGLTVDLAARVSLHTGRVLVGEMGSGETREHHALTGVTPNIAARLEQHAPRNGVVISAQTRALVESSFQLRSLGRKDLKGVTDPVEIFHVTGRTSSSTVLPRGAGALIGRDAEIGALLGVWTRAGAGETVQRRRHGGTRRRKVDARGRVSGPVRRRACPDHRARRLGGRPEHALRQHRGHGRPAAPLRDARGRSAGRHRGLVLAGRAGSRPSRADAPAAPERDAAAIEDPRRAVLAAAEALVRNRAKPLLVAIEGRPLDGRVLARDR